MDGWTARGWQILLLPAYHAADLGDNWDLLTQASKDKGDSVLEVSRTSSHYPCDPTV